jgi:glycosyltransferase involved in cell wall biosynthesis
MLSAFTISKNLLTLGHTFVETCLSLIDYVDEYIVLECGSSDETPYWWERLRNKHPEKIRFEYAEWPNPATTVGTHGQKQGRSTGILHDVGLERCRGDYALCAHADEVWHPESAAVIRSVLENQPGAVSVPYLHLYSWQNIYHHYANCFTRSEILVRTRSGWHADGDGWRLWLGRGPIIHPDFPKPLIHAGYVFPINIHKKNIHHATLYPDMPRYQQLAEESKRILASGDFGPEFDLTTSPFDLPDILKPLVGVKEYFVRESLFL